MTEGESDESCKIRLSEEVMEILYPPSEKVRVSDIRVSIIQLDTTFSELQMKQIFKTKKPIKVTFSTLNGLMYQTGATVMIASEHYSFPTFGRVIEVSDNDHTTEDKPIWDVTLEILMKGVN